MLNVVVKPRAPLLSFIFGRLEIQISVKKLVCLLPIIIHHNITLHSRYSDWLWAGWPRGQSSNPGRFKNFLFSTSCRPALGPLSLLSNGNWVLFLWGLNGRGMKLTTHLQLVPRLGKCGSIHPLPHIFSWG
jgi:hypothetical protein